jgi:hypothetical protein
MRSLIGIAIAALMAMPVMAESVDVKYWGYADLSTYDCVDTESSFVNRICYEADESHVVVLLRSTYYAYCQVESETVADWISADSIGRFYNQNIKSNAVDGRYACQ